MIKRRVFIAGLGSAAAWPVVTRAQQGAIPVVGYLHSSSLRQDELSAFQKGLGELGFVELRNVVIEDGRTMNTRGCRNWRPLWCTVESLPPRLRPRRSPSSC
jgi:hypothetical protein